MEVDDLLAQLTHARKYQSIEFFEPYDYQKKFYFAKGYQSDDLARIRGLMAANQVGKTLSAAREVSYHLTGLYPIWWEGHRFDHAITCLSGGITNEATRDIIQAELFGDPSDPEALGMGAIPKHLIVGKPDRKPGVTNAYDAALVRHVSGVNSKIMLRAYEQGKKKHMGLRIDLGWMDEEPPYEIYSQYLRGTIATNGILMSTFTPENGVTSLVHQLIYEPQPGMALIRASWDDAPHLSEARKTELLSQFPAHERAMRSKGEPMAGSGLVFPIVDDDIRIEPFEIPKHWVRIIGIDFGWDHPFAIACLAYDTETGTAYLYDCFRGSKLTYPVQCAAINARTKGWIPVAWPHDGMKNDPQSGNPIRDIFESEYGVPMLDDPFSNPPAVGEEEGSGGNGVEVGLLAMFSAMEQGRFKVFTNCADFFEEKAIYHRKANDESGSIQLQKIRDDVISATRYAYQSLRFADFEHTAVRRNSTRAGTSNW